MSNLLAALPSTFRSHPVIPFAPNAGVDRTHAWDWTGRADTIASGLATASVDPTIGTEEITLTYVGLTRADARAIESFVETQCGRKTGFWCPTFQQDFYATQNGGTAIIVRDWGFADVYAVGTANYSVNPFRAFSAYRAGSGGSTNWCLALWSPVGTAGTDAAGFPLRQHNVDGFSPTGNNLVFGTSLHGATDGLVLMRMPFCRFADDAMTTEWDHPALANITLRVVTIPYETPA